MSLKLPGPMSGATDNNRGPTGGTGRLQVRTMISPVLLLAVCLLSALNSAADELSIGRMQVAIWPEYDDQTVLAIYEGRFEDVSRFPIKTSFPVPKGSIINDACSLSHEGQHFCQLYTINETPDFDEVQVYLPYPNFYLSFHYAAFDIANEKREFSHRIRSNHLVQRLDVDIQQPLRSEAFNLSPNDGELKVFNNENHYFFGYDDIEQGDSKTFDISYVKHDNKPSVDIKYSRMTGPKVFSSPYETQRNIRMIMYVAFGTGIVGLFSLVLWLLRGRLKKSAAGVAADNASYTSVQHDEVRDL